MIQIGHVIIGEEKNKMTKVTINSVEVRNPVIRLREIPDGYFLADELMAEAMTAATNVLFFKVWKHVVRLDKPGMFWDNPECTFRNYVSIKEVIITVMK